MPLCNDLIKDREIRFKLSTQDQARKAEQLLKDVPGVESIEAMTSRSLRIRYSVEDLTLQMIEAALREVGFDLDDGLLNRLKRAVFSYCEDALRASIGVEESGSDSTPSLSLPQHAVQDPRPHDWHKYV